MRTVPSTPADRLAAARKALDVELNRINGILDRHAENKERVGGRAIDDSSPLIQKTLSELEGVTKRFKELADKNDA
jgi:hypothetical protein